MNLQRPLHHVAEEEARYEGRDEAIAVDQGGGNVGAAGQCDGADTLERVRRGAKSFGLNENETADRPGNGTGQRPQQDLLCAEDQPVGIAAIGHLRCQAGKEQHCRQRQPVIQSAFDRQCPPRSLRDVGIADDGLSERGIGGRQNGGDQCHGNKRPSGQERGRGQCAEDQRQGQADHQHSHRPHMAFAKRHRIDLRRVEKQQHDQRDFRYEMQGFLGALV